MCKMMNYNLCKRGGGLSESTPVSNAQNFSVKSNTVIRAQSAQGGLCLFILSGTMYSNRNLCAFFAVMKVDFA